MLKTVSLLCRVDTSGFHNDCTVSMPCSAAVIASAAHHCSARRAPVGGRTFLSTEIKHSTCFRVAFMGKIHWICFKMR